MAKKKKKQNKKDPALKQRQWDITKGVYTGDPGSSPTGTDKWFKQSYEAAGGGAKGANVKGGGPGGTGFSIDWSQVDFGKAELSNKMNNAEGPTKQQLCAQKGGVWNEEKGICEKKEKREEEVVDTKENGEEEKVDAEVESGEEACNCESLGYDTNSPLAQNAEAQEFSKRTGVGEGETSVETPVDDKDAEVDERNKELTDCERKCAKKYKKKEGADTSDDVGDTGDDTGDDTGADTDTSADTNIDTGDDTQANVPQSQGPSSENLGVYKAANQNFENFGSSTYTRKQQKAHNKAMPTENQNAFVDGLGGLDKNSATSKMFGGGDFTSWDVETLFDKDGKQSGFVNKGRQAGMGSWNYSFNMQKRGDQVTMKFVNLPKETQDVFGYLGLPRDRKQELSAAQWGEFKRGYDQLLATTNTVINRIKEKGVKNEDLRYEILKDEYWPGGIEQMHAGMKALRMNSRGFFNGDFSGEDTPVNFKSQYDYTQPIPFQFKSPFARRDRGYLKLRENWMPTPMNYGTPFHQEAPQQQSIQNQQFGDIWEKIKAYGTDMEKKVDKFIKHTNYSPEADKPIASFQNQQWVGIITKWLQEQKAATIKAKNAKNNDEQQRISTAVNTLIQDVTTYSGKFLDWIERNAGDQEEGNAGGSVVSQGSRKDEKFIGNTTFMGDQNTTIAIGEDGKIGIKSFGLPEVKYVEELDTDVFAKDDMGYMQFIQISEQLQKDAESGKPLNENVIKGSADNLLRNEDSILSWAFDPLYGQSWLQDYAQGNPNLDLDVFMPESPKFDIDLLTDELHGWLTSKLKEAYDQNVPEQPEQKGDKAQGIMDETLANVEQEKQNKEGVYAESEEQAPPQEAMAQAPPQEAMTQAPQGTPMAYTGKLSPTAKDILRKYNRL